MNLCNNYTYTGISHTIIGFNIEVRVDYTVGPICLGALQMYSWADNLGMLPAGTYTITSKTFLNAVQQDVSVETVSVGTCCTAAASFNSSKPFGCAADIDSFTFINTSTSTSNEWYVNGVLSATTTDFTTALNTAGPQSIKLVTADASCSDSITQIYQIYDNPVVNLGADVNSCIGETEMLAATSGYSSYLWSTGSTAEFIWVNSEDNYYVTVINSDGCSTTDSNYVSYNTRPTPFLGEDTIICEGDQLTLDPGTYDAYSWNPFASTQTIDATFSFAYSVNVTDSNGCVGGDTINVTVNPAPAISFPNDTVEICDGETTTLMSPGMFDTYEWSTLETSTSIDVSTEANYTLSVTANSCENSDDVYVKVNVLPTLDLGMDTVQNCEGATVTIDAGTSFDSYLWNTSETSSSIDAMTQGNYSVIVTHENNCTKMDEVFLNVNSAPVVNLGEDQDLCTTDKITLNAGAFAAYEWNDASTGATLEIIGANEGLGAKTVSVEVTNENSCKGTDEIVITIKDCATDISSLALENSISVNPNPASNFIELKSEKSDYLNIEIYSTLGELVFSIEEFNTSNKIDITTLNSGIYFMNITVNNDKLIKQFVKTK